MLKLRLAKREANDGPLVRNDKNYREIYILTASTTEEADEMIAGDPAITNGVPAVEYYRWYGSAALSQYLEVQKRY